MSSAATISTLDATGQAELVRRGEVTAVELVEAAIAMLSPGQLALNREDAYISSRR